MGIRRLTLTRAIRVARGNDVACREAGDTKSTLISASWPSYTLLSMPLSVTYGKYAHRIPDVVAYEFYECFSSQ